MSQLIAKHLAKSYNRRKVIHDVSLMINSGEVVGLLGPNGAGKTTCFYMIAGIVRADNGIIEINGTDITHKAIDSRSKLGLGYLPQEPSIFRTLSVADNISAILETRKDIKRQQRLQILDTLLDEFRIQHIRDALGMSLSGGERRRVEIARALACEPEFILLDEPFAGVDPISVGDIKSIIDQLKNRGIGVLITDHNVRETLDIVDRAYIIHDGAMLMEGTPNEVVQHSGVRQVYLGDRFSI